MTESTNPKQYDLEDRTLDFARRVRAFVSRLPKSTANFEDGKQVVRSSGSIGANYIEANESLSPKDFLMRVKICKKEAKETKYWLNLIGTGSVLELEQERQALIQESKELMFILAAIIRKTS